MNLTKLKNYAPIARTAIITAVTRRAAILGIQPGRVEEVTESGDVALIGGQPFPRSIVPLRKQLLPLRAALRLCASTCRTTAKHETCVPRSAHKHSTRDMRAMLCQTCVPIGCWAAQTSKPWLCWSLPRSAHARQLPPEYVTAWKRATQ